MSEENGKVCCNCRHCIRVEKNIENNLRYIECYCDVNRKLRWLSYLSVMTHWCRRWARDKSWDKSEVKE